MLMALGLLMGLREDMMKMGEIGVNVLQGYLNDLAKRFGVGLLLIGVFMEIITILILLPNAVINTSGVELLLYSVAVFINCVSKGREFAIYLLALFLIILSVLISVAFIITFVRTCFINPVKTVNEVRARTAEDQSGFSANEIISRFNEGNKRFANNKPTLKELPKEIQAEAKAQFPLAVILSCMDIKDVKMGNITSLLQKVKPAIDKSASYPGDKSYKNHDFIDLVCLNNVFVAINENKARSPILKEMANKGEIRIDGAVYDMNTGIVKFLE